MIYLPARFFLWTIPFGFDKMESAYNGGLIYGSVRTTNQKIQEQKRIYAGEARTAGRSHNAGGPKGHGVGRYLIISKKAREWMLTPNTV